MAWGVKAVTSEETVLLMVVDGPPVEFAAKHDPALVMMSVAISILGGWAATELGRADPDTLVPGFSTSLAVEYWRGSTPPKAGSNHALSQLRRPGQCLVETSAAASSAVRAIARAVMDVGYAPASPLFREG